MRPARRASASTRMAAVRLTAVALLWLCALPSAAAQEPALNLELDPLTQPVPQPAPQPDEQPRPKERKPSPWRLGITAGYQHSTTNWLLAVDGMEINMRDQVRSHPGFTVGINASLPFGQVWSFDTGANFSMWGFGYSGAGTTLTSTQYALAVPLLITFFESNARIPVFLQAGLQAGIILFGTQRIEASWSDPHKGRSPFSLASCGVVLGIGFANFTFQFIQNFTDGWNRDMRHTWEQQTGQTLVNQLQRAYCLTYTYWF